MNPQPVLNPTNPPVLQCTDIRRSFSIDRKDGSQPVDLQILRGVTLEVPEGAVVSIVGASGSGKSTLLHILGGLDAPSAGSVAWSGESIASISDERLSALRIRHVGFVFQFHHLLPEFSAIENVAIAAMIGGKSKKDALEHATALLDRVGLAARAEHKPSELSGGEQQRTAIARALANNPKVILADEPSGNLDSTSAGLLMELILDLNAKEKQTFVIVTHNEDYARRSGRVLVMKDGLLQTRN